MLNGCMLSDSMSGWGPLKFGVGNSRAFKWLTFEGTGGN